MHSHAIPEPLANPVWSALTTAQRALAAGAAPLWRFPRDVAPFVAIGDRDSPLDGLLAALLEPDEAVTFVGVIPGTVPDGTQVEREGRVMQMVSSSPPPAPPRVDFRELDAGDVPAMLALTALVYPGYFRARTPAMGTYLGVFADGELVAMAGERMRLEGYQEISAVCTHPRFTGRGFARALVVELMQRSRARGLVPFLHVDAGNDRAQALYRQLGFEPTRELALARLRRS